MVGQLWSRVHVVVPKPHWACQGARTLPRPVGTPNLQQWPYRVKSVWPGWGGGGSVVSHRGPAALLDTGLYRWLLPASSGGRICASVAASGVEGDGRFRFSFCHCRLGQPCLEERTRREA